MPRYALKIEYDGTPFSGWQWQEGRPTVQSRLEAALARLAPDLPRTVAAGRTDSGVHALGQVVHIDLGRAWDPFRLSEALNYHLKPQPISILAAAEVEPDFSARFSAIERRYLFRVLIRRAPPALDAGRVWRVPHALNVEAMRVAAAHLEGRHDFTTFRSAQCQAESPVRTIDEVRIDAAPLPHGTELHVHVRARSFLHHQVRSFVGTLERVGAGAWTPGDVKRALDAQDRSACGPVCPPQGLYLAGVGYPVDPFAAAAGAPAMGGASGTDPP